MTSQVSKSGRRAGVVVNYGSLLLILAALYVATGGGLNLLSGLIGGLSLAVFIISFIMVHARTRLWHMTHSRGDRLDERQMMVTHEALRFSYIYFTIAILVLLLCFELLREFLAGGFNPPLIPVFAALIYLAHTLPSSILAWTEKEI